MRKDRMEKLAKFLETLPNENFYMGSWMSNVPDEFVGTDKCFTKSQAISCGTACCIAGWAAFVGGNRLCADENVRTASGKNLGHVTQWAQRYLGLTERQEDRLFYTSGWPDQFRKEYSETNTQAAARIRYMIETGE